jgi:hypothetical protein
VGQRAGGWGRRGGWGAKGRREKGDRVGEQGGWGSKGLRGGGRTDMSTRHFLKIWECYR